MDSGRYMVVACLLALSYSATTASSESIIRLPSANHLKPSHEINLLCESWKFAVDTNDAPFFPTVPMECARFVEEYMTGDRYLSDSMVVADFAASYARSLNLAGDGKDAWVFDVDETLLSNLPYYAKHGYGTQPWNETSFYEWAALAQAPALPASLWLYKEVEKLGFTIFVLTARDEFIREATVKNLMLVGYSNYKGLILRQPKDSGKSDQEFKSEKRRMLEKEGYIIRGSCGDLWTDLNGFAIAERSFKLPNIMYA